MFLGAVALRMRFGAAPAAQPSRIESGEIGYAVAHVHFTVGRAKSWRKERTPGAACPVPGITAGGGMMTLIVDISCDCP